MKALRVWIVTAVIILSLVSTRTIAATGPIRNSHDQKTAESIEAGITLARLDEINAMDKATLTRAEKRDLRREVRTSEKRMKEIGGGVYLSVGALLIILILLIVLL